MYFLGAAYNMAQCHLVLLAWQQLLSPETFSKRMLCTLKVGSHRVRASSFRRAYKKSLSAISIGSIHIA